MPVHNRESLVRRAIDSVLSQEFGDFELIVVDDGSTDATAAVVESIDDGRIRLIRLERNCGSNAARNRGIEAARAPLIAFLDSDDAYLPQKLSTVVRVFSDRSEVEVLIDSFRRIRPDGRRMDARRNPVIDTSDEFLRALFARRLWKATSAISLRREAAIRAGMFDERLRRRQDMDFLARLAGVARCGSLDEVLWVKYWTPGAISDGGGGFIAATIELARRYPQYLANSDYRPGLARDSARHFVRLLRGARLAAAGRDARALAREFGWAELMRLELEGSREMAARRLKRWSRRRS